MKKHFKKRLFLSLLISSLASSSLVSVSYSSLHHAHESSWLFLEELIIKEPERQINAPIGAGGALVLGSLGTGALTYKVTNYLTGTSGKLGKIGAGVAGIAAGFLQHYALRTRFLQDAERSQIITIMKIWPQLRDKLPYEVWSCLDSLHNQWVHDKENFNTSLATSVAYLKSEIYGHFARKYGDNTSPFFSHRNLHVKVTFDLYKAIKSFFTSVRELLV